jgi:predicted enzyme related to lactoylglutathione lyase
MGRVGHFEIHAEDPERAIAFYRDLFGWEISKWDGPVDYWLVTTGPDSEPGINGAILPHMGGAAGEGQGPNAFVCTVGVEDIGATERAVQGAGGEQVVARQEIPGVGKLSYFKDTEGNVFGALEPVAES